MSKIVQPSPDQQKIVQLDDNIVVTAKPGSGKTFTIVEKINRISKNLFDYQGVIAISFTKKASEELKTRCERKGINNKNNFYGTIDKFYISEIIVPFSKILLGKVVELEVIEGLEDDAIYKYLKEKKEFLNKDELLEKSLLKGEIYLELCGETAMYILSNVPEAMLYLKSKYSHVFIDEYQDCGQIQHDIFLKIVDSGLTGIAVGDLDQAIYGFSKRYSKYLFALLSDKRFTHLRMSKNYRCHESIANYSLALMGVPDLKPLEQTRVFKVNILGDDEAIMGAIESKIELIKNRLGLENNSDFAILCRGNESVRRASFFLNIPNKLFIETPLDHSNSYWGVLFNDLLSNFFSYKSGSSTKLDFVSVYVNEEYEQRRFYKALDLLTQIYELEEENLSFNANIFKKFAELIHPNHKDEKVFLELINILSDKSKLNSFKPASKEQINIMTLHKSKGLEFKCVFLLDLYRWIFPFEGDHVTKEDYTQSLNLFYVGVTRAISCCFIMIGTQRFRSKQKDLIEARESPFLYLNNTPELRGNLSWNTKSTMKEG
ncbi:UvrD-helicase domain-containing protein [Saccharibacillus sacchari]|uniref:UvrD-helicase domain-containing protein n=1 Tax=Saccharibacillus sacchari TaxID=456493 RepID=UPI0004B2D54A|nr:ATP-dependent helicase [Saccharibacillus sacchari]